MNDKDKSANMFILGLLVFGGACVALAPLSLAGESFYPRSPAPAPHTHPGMTISIDPDSGEMRSGAPDTNLQLPTSLSHSMSTSFQGLQEIQSPDDPGKGVQVNLQGRFQSPLVASQNEAGKIVIQHQHINPDNPQ